jgi:hypothetical protein
MAFTALIFVRPTNAEHNHVKFYTDVLVEKYCKYKQKMIYALKKTVTVAEPIFVKLICA